MLTIRDILELPSLAEFRPVAGNEGLDRQVKMVNILDYEYTEVDPEPYGEDGKLNPGALVLTSFLAARDRPELILLSIKHLEANGCSALAVKTVYYDELPREALDYADSIQLPVFLFDRTDFENIVYEVTKDVYQENRMQNLEKTVNKIMDENRPIEERLRLSRELIPQLKMPFFCDYYRPKQAIDLFEYERLMNDLWKYDNRGICFFPYKSGILLVCEEAHRRFANSAIPHRSRYYHGSSEAHIVFEDMPYAFAESVSATLYAEKHNREEASFSEMGLMQIVIPNRGNYWLNRFCSRTARILKAADKDKSDELYNTVCAYVEEGMDFAATAERLSLHGNSVRYRIQKAKEVLGYEDDPVLFEQVIGLMVLYEKMK